MPPHECKRAIQITEGSFRNQPDPTGWRIVDHPPDQGNRPRAELNEVIQSSFQRLAVGWSVSARTRSVANDPKRTHNVEWPTFLRLRSAIFRGSGFIGELRLGNVFPQPRPGLQRILIAASAPGRQLSRIPLRWILDPTF